VVQPALWITTLLQRRRKDGVPAGGCTAAGSLRQEVKTPTHPISPKCGEMRLGYPFVSNIATGGTADSHRS
jgi:hypothetical protein